MQYICAFGVLGVAGASTRACLSRILLLRRLRNFGEKNNGYSSGSYFDSNWSYYCPGGRYFNFDHAPFVGLHRRRLPDLYRVERFTASRALMRQELRSSGVQESHRAGEGRRDHALENGIAMFPGPIL